MIGVDSDSGLDGGSTVYGSEVYTVYKAGSRWASSGVSGSPSSSPAKRASVTGSSSLGDQSSGDQSSGDGAFERPGLPGTVPESPDSSSASPGARDPGSSAVAGRRSQAFSAAGIPLVAPKSDNTGGDDVGTPEAPGIHPTLFSEAALPEGLRWVDTARSGLSTLRSGLSSAASAYGAFGTGAAYAIRTPRDAPAVAPDQGAGTIAPITGKTAAPAALAIAIERYDAADDSELTVEAGAVVAVEHEDQSGWWECRVVSEVLPGGGEQAAGGSECGRRGFLPCTFLQWATREDISSAAVPAGLVEAIKLGRAELVGCDTTVQPGQRKTSKPATAEPRAEEPEVVASVSADGAWSGKGVDRVGGVPSAPARMVAGMVSTDLEAVEEEDEDGDDGAQRRPSDQASGSETTPAGTGAERAGGMGEKLGSGLWRYNLVNDRWERRDPSTGSVQTSEDPFAEEWAVEDIDELEWDLADDDFDDDQEQSGDLDSAAMDQSAAGLSSHASIRMMASVVSAGLRSARSCASESAEHHGFAPSAPDDQEPSVLYEAHTEYLGNAEEGELAMTAGDLIAVDTFDDSGWWEGVNNRTGMRGWLPSTFVKPHQP
jgi:hypothetical protein